MSLSTYINYFVGQLTTGLCLTVAVELLLKLANCMTINSVPCILSYDVSLLTCSASDVELDHDNGVSQGTTASSYGTCWMELPTFFQDGDPSISGLLNATHRLSGLPRWLMLEQRQTRDFLPH